MFTDAGCKGSYGSYAYFVDESLKGSSSIEGFVNPTSCELLAVIIGLKRLAGLGYKRVLVKTDSQYVEGVMKNREHWMKQEKKSHRRLVMRLFKAMDAFDEVTAKWIPEFSEGGIIIAHSIATARLREAVEVCVLTS